MFKQVNSQASTKQLRKAKFFQGSRQVTTTRTKVMLTDLCLEQKAKIGDLVRILQSRKIENSSLQEQLRQQQQKYQSRIQQMQKIIESNKIIQAKYQQQIALLKRNEQQKQKCIQRLLLEKQQKNKELPKNRQKVIYAAYVDQFALTEQITTNNQYSQTSTKKKKQKSVQTQINDFPIQQRKRYPNNSKSFEKIMKNNRIDSNSCQRQTKISTNSLINHNRYIANNQNNDKQSQGQSDVLGDGWQESAEREGNEEEREEDEMEKEEAQIKQEDGYDIQREQQQNNEQDKDFNELAQKWMSLKQKNMSKIKQSYQKSKQKIQNINYSSYKNNEKSMSKERSTKKTSKSIGIPQSFNIAQQQQQHSQSNCTPQIKSIIEDNQSFGPKIHKQISNIHLNMDNDFDEIELNKILKLKNFSASKLLNNKSKIQNIDDYQKNLYRKQIGNISEDRSSNGIAVGKKKSKVIGNSNSSTNNMNNSRESNSKSKKFNNNMDFYETDLLDIVTSISRPS